MRVETPPFLIPGDLDNDFLLYQILKEVCHCGSFVFEPWKTGDAISAWRGLQERQAVTMGDEVFDERA